VDFLDASSLIGLESVSIARENNHFLVDGNAVYGGRLIRGFDHCPARLVHQGFLVIGKGRFSHNQSVG
jgi:hypothetical protein